MEAFLKPTVSPGRLDKLVSRYYVNEVRRMKGLVEFTGVDDEAGFCY